MFKWHVHSAIGRGRPAGEGFARVTDGIAASLRAFSVSAKRAEEDEHDSKAPSVRQRSTAAVQELSAFNTAPPKGVDARSLAAKPPPLKIIRYNTDGPVPGKMGFGFGAGAGAGTGLGSGFGGARGGAPRRGGGSRRKRVSDFDDDDDEDYNNYRPRNTFRGGRGGGRGGRAAIDPSEILEATERGKPDPYEVGRKPSDFEAEDDYTDEEEDYINMAAGGGNHVYNPETSLENLQRWRPATIQSPAGVMENVRYRLAVATDNHHPQYRPSRDHNMRVNRGIGTLFESIHQKAVMQEWKDDKELGNAIEWGKNWYQEDFGELSKEQKNEVMKQWVAGHYEVPKAPGQTQDVLSYVRSYMNRNETFLSADKQKMESKLKQLLPPQFLGESKTQGKARAR